MINPDLGDQLTHILASLEKATPQVLELATKMMRQEAVALGATELICLILCVASVLWLMRWRERDAAKNEVKPRYEQSSGELRTLAICGIICGGIAVLVLVLAIPAQVTKFTNARYYAIADLLARVKP